MNNGKEQIVHNICKDHTNKSEKDLYKLCPSKLSKSELEDLYFALSDNNVFLKKTINNQQEQIKVLNTKVQRLTAQKIGVGNKDCCSSSSRAVINNQKELIADVRQANERLAERIRILNMRLCSAKQFLRRSPQSASYCAKCFSSNTCIKNLSTSVLNTKRSETNLRMAITSSQSLDRESTQKKLTKNTSTQVKILLPEEPCQQNKCRTTQEELTQKIATLKEELIKTQNQYTDRLSKLEEEVTTLRSENVRIRAEHSETEHKLRAKQRESINVLQKLRDAEAMCEDLNAQLIIEKGKVSELETQIKANDISKQVAKALETQTKNFSLVPLPTITMENTDKIIKHSDDSGYTESITRECDNKGTSNVDQFVLKKMTNLQTQLDNLKHSMEKLNTISANEDMPIMSDDLLIHDLVLDVKAIDDKHSTESNDTIVLPTHQNKIFSCLSQRHDKTNSNEDLYDRGKNLLKKELSTDSKIPLPIKTLKAPNSSHSKIIYDETHKDGKHTNENAIDKPLNSTSHVTKNINNNGKDSKTTKSLVKRKSKDSNISFDECNVMDSKKDNGNERNGIKKGISKAELHSEFESTIDNESRNFDKSDDIKKGLNNEEVDVYSTDSKNTNDDVVASDSSGHNTFVVETKLNGKDNKQTNKDNLDSESNKILHRKFSKDNLSKRPSRDKNNPLHFRNGIKIGPSKTSEGMPKPLATSSPSRQTYVVSRSSDNTECEISSLSDLPNELYDKSPLDYISPGEERASTSYTDSYATTTTDYYYLSEGELPVTEVKKLSFAEVNITDSIGHQSVSNMHEAMRAISEELVRCRDLLDGRKQVIIPDVPAAHSHRLAYQYL